MNEAIVLRKVKADFDAISGIGALIPGGLQEGFSTSSTSPYARCEIAVEKLPYKSDQTRVAIYSVLVEVIADNPTAATLVSIDAAFQSLLATSKSGTMGGVGGEPTGTVSYAWQKPPGGRSLMTAEERRAGKSIVGSKMAMTIRVEW